MANKPFPFKVCEQCCDSTGGGGSSVEIDKTLSIAGAAADAKAVGDVLGDVKEALERIKALQEQYMSYGVNPASEGGDIE